MAGYAAAGCAMRREARRFCATLGYDVSTPVVVDQDWEMDHQVVEADKEPFPSLRALGAWEKGYRGRSGWERHGPYPYNDYSEREGTFEEEPDGETREHTMWLAVERCSGLPLTFAEAVQLDRLLLDHWTEYSALKPEDQPRYDAERMDMIIRRRHRQRIVP